MKKYAQDHLDHVFAKLEKDGLNITLSSMAQNIIRFRIRGSLPYLPRHKEDVLERIQRVNPEMLQAVIQVFKNVGG